MGCVAHRTLFRHYLAPLPSVWSIAAADRITTQPLRLSHCMHSLRLDCEINPAEGNDWMSMRLQSKAPDVVRRLTLATSLQRRNIAIAAAEWALRMNDLNDLELINAAKQLREHGRFSTDATSKLEELIKKFDDEYFDAEDSGAAEEASMQLFGRARAVSALLYAGSDDALIAAKEAVYEAWVATHDEKPLLDLVRSYLP